jgi:phosphoglycerate dehydrogenase-like enzyme
MSQPLRIWIGLRFTDEVVASLRAMLAPHEVVISPLASTSNVNPGGRDDSGRDCDVLFGQPHPDDIAANPRAKLVQLGSAGYTRYDNDAFRAAVAARALPVCNSSSVYDEPCAQHALAMILAASRQLGAAYVEQREQAWNLGPLRLGSTLLRDQSAVLVGYGAIARRLVQLLQPFGMTLLGVRRRPRGDEPIAMIPTPQLDARLGEFDHVVNILPLSESTRGFFSAQRLGQMKRGATFHNIGRGDTVDQDALIARLHDGHLGAAYLDVTTPEPLPRGHPLWTAPRCYITPHTAGGWHDEPMGLLRHLAANVRRLQAGEPLLDRIA